jgi:hypothetical protein
LPSLLGGEERKTSNNMLNKRVRTPLGDGLVVEVRQKELVIKLDSDWHTENAFTCFPVGEVELIKLPTWHELTQRNRRIQRNPDWISFKDFYLE